MMSRKVAMILIGCTAVPAIRLYYVQEMIAALIIFSALFMGVWVVVFLILLLDWAVGQMITWAEVHIAAVERWMMDVGHSAMAKPVWAHTAAHGLPKEKLKEK